MNKPIKLITCVGVTSDLQLLPHFLRHYLDLTVPADSFYVLLNAADEDVRELGEGECILKRFGIVNVERWIAPYTSDGMWSKRREVQERVASSDDWIISADVDEFHEYPQQLPELLADCDRKSVNCIQGVFIDRLAPNGALVNPSDGLPPDATFPVIGDVICALGGIGRHHSWHGTVKLMAFKGNVFPSRGGHHPMAGQSFVRYLAGKPLASFVGISEPWFRFSFPFRVHHYKWTASLVSSLERRLRTPGVSEAGREYGEKLLEYIERNKGIAMDDISRCRGCLLNLLPWRTRMTLLKRLDGRAIAGRSLRAIARRLAV